MDKFKASTAESLGWGRQWKPISFIFAGEHPKSERQRYGRQMHERVHLEMAERYDEKVRTAAHEEGRRLHVVA